MKGTAIYFIVELHVFYLFSTLLFLHCFFIPKNYFLHPFVSQRLAFASYYLQQIHLIIFKYYLHHNMSAIKDKIAGIKEKVFGKSHKLQILSDIWEKPIGEYCNVCQTKLKEQQSISICKCVLFCHEECFVKQISPYLTMNSQVQCQRCDQYVNMTMNISVLWTCNKRPSYIFSVIGSLLMIIGLYVIIADGVYTPYVPDAFSYSILSLIALFLLYAIVKSSRRKIVKVEDVKVMDTKSSSKTQTQKGMMPLMMDDTLGTKGQKKGGKLSDTVSRVQLAEFEII